MRIWSIHPKHLDTKGLVALWRETLLAKNVLKGNTKGYKNHPQLDRFRDNPSLIDSYLSFVYDEACVRGYKFDKTKIDWNFSQNKINVTKGQFEYEMTHLLKKLKDRDIATYNKLIKCKPEAHPIFDICEGEIEKWEKI